MPRKAKERANGPYSHGQQFRVVLSPAPLDGSSRYRYFATHAQAQEYLDEFDRGTDTRSCGEAVDMYLDHLKRYGGSKGRPLRPSSIVTVRYKLCAVLGLKWNPDGVYAGDRPLTEVSPRVAAKAYAARVKAVKPDTHRGELVQVNALFDWAVSKKWIDSNPFAGVRAEGVLSAGKEQLRIDEERRFIERALAEGTVAGWAVVATSILGVRASELVDRVGRDVDDGGRVLWIPSSKTAAGRRAIVVPDAYGLREALAGLAAKVGVACRLFGTMTRWTLRTHVQRICELAGVPVVTTHALRGAVATRIVERGGSAESAARYLGQAGAGVTRRHYVADGAEQSAMAAQKAEILETNKEQTVSIEVIDGSDTEVGAWIN